MMKQFILIIFFVISFNKIISQIPADNIESAVYISLSRIDGNILTKYDGTGFFYQDSLHTYLITAHHVLYDSLGKLKSAIGSVNFYDKNSDSKTPDKITLDLSFLESEKKIKYKSNYDIVAIELGDSKKLDSINGIAFNKYVHHFGKLNLMVCSPKLIKRFKDISIGNDVFIIGYPTSVTQGKTPIYDFNRPLLRKGAVAGKDVFQTKIIVDCFANKGNSGGPVIYKSQTEVMVSNYSLIGIVVAVNIYGNSNTGYSIVEPIDKILEVIYSK
ncbi:MAG: trypsin-like peptidase domain-containing protein [Hyphomonadaceae bacterium]|nr:trypsin-like peptidase domain-containing protein [Hyphomonadaceae bacterium]